MLRHAESLLSALACYRDAVDCESRCHGDTDLPFWVPTGTDFGAVIRWLLGRVFRRSMEVELVETLPRLRVPLTLLLKL